MFIFCKYIRYKDARCKARIVLNGETKAIVNRSGEHTHVGEARDISVKRHLNELKERAVNSHDSIRSIVADATVAAENDVILSAMPTVPSMSRVAYRARNEVVSYPENPSSLEEIILPEEFSITEKNENFLFYDSGSENNRIIMFATKENLQFLSRSDGWHIDGTFETAPKLFHQVFTIHGKKFLFIKYFYF